MSQWNREAIRRILEQRLSLIDLRAAAYDADPEFDVESPGRKQLVLDLLLYFERRDQREKLIEWIQRNRPDIDLQDVEFVQSVEDYLNRGNTYHDKGEFNRAIAEYDKAIRLKPDNAIAYLNKGAAYFFKGNLDQAMVDFNQAIALDPYLASAYYSRGLVYQERGDTERATADFRMVVDLNNAPGWVEKAKAQLGIPESR